MVSHLHKGLGMSSFHLQMGGGVNRAPEKWGGGLGKGLN